MKYSSVAFSALVANALAQQPQFLNSDFHPTQGTPFTLKFSGCNSGCTITLENGPGTNLKPVKTLTSSASGGSFTFTPEGLPSDTYAFKISDNASGEMNYSIQFAYQGTGTASSATGSATSTTGTATGSTSATTTGPSTSSSMPITSTLTHSSTMTSMSMNSTTATQSGTGSSSRVSSTSGPRTTGSSGSSSTSIPTVPNAAVRASSPIALVVGAVAAMVYLS